VLTSRYLCRIPCPETNEVAVESGGEDALGWQGDREAEPKGQATELVLQALEVAVPAPTQSSTTHTSTAHPTLA